MEVTVIELVDTITLEEPCECMSNKKGVEFGLDTLDRA